MDKFCSNCGKKLNENADVCLNCGVLVNKHINYTKEKSGNAMSIASMIIGIFAFCLAIPESFDYDYNIEFIFNQIFAMAFPLVGLIFSIIGFIKSKNGYNISGIILNTISIIILIMVIIMAIFI